MAGVSDRDLWLQRVASVRRYQRGGERAPHKPLLLLYALGQLSAGRRSIPWVDTEAPLAQLLDTFGPPNPTQPNHPFRRLAGDDHLWTLSTDTGDLPSLDASGRQLRDAGAVGRLSDAFVAAIGADPALPVLIARYLLEDNWPTSLHDDIASAVGLDLDGAEASLVRSRLVEDRGRRRDPTFRSRVLMAYEYQCAACGYDGRLDRTSVGLEAAHVRWWSADGPDSVDNGLCLCSLHHVLFDSGVMGVDDEHRITVSKQFFARARAGEELVIRLAGADLREPQAGEPPPAADHISWHGQQVFRGPARVA